MVTASNPATESLEQLRVGFNAALLSSPSMRGWNRYAINLLEAMQSLNVQFLLCSREQISPLFLDRLNPERYSLCVSGPMNYTYWEQVWLPRQLRKANVDVFHSPFHFGIPFNLHCPSVVTLHDAIDQSRWPRFRSWREMLRPGVWTNFSSHWIARYTTNRIVTVSDHSRTELIRHLRVAEDRLAVVPEAADPLFNRRPTEHELQTVRERFQLASPYFFYIGGFDDRKNLRFLVDAFKKAALPDTALVLGGGSEHDRERVRKYAEQMGISPQLRILGPVDDTDLPALYRMALAFVYPSKHEGFGLQLCEAMAMSCPILAANATSLPEVLGEGGLLFPLDNCEPLAAQLRLVATDENTRLQLSERSFKRASHFCWQKTAERTRMVYASLASRKA